MLKKAFSRSSLAKPIADVSNGRHHNRQNTGKLGPHSVQVGSPKNRLLEKYPSWKAFHEAFPKIKIKPLVNRLTIDNTMKNLEIAVKPNRLRKELLKAYEPSEVLFGLRALIGKEKGLNKYSKLLEDGVILRYGANANDVSKPELDTTLQKEIVTCVRLARTAVESALDGIVKDTVLRRQILHHHFNLRHEDAEITATIRENFEKVKNGLAGHLVIAENRPTEPVGTAGYVSFKASFREGSIDRPKTTYVEIPGHHVVLYRTGSIHLSFSDLDASSGGVRRWSDLDVAVTIIHEAVHKFCTFHKDEALTTKVRYRLLPTHQHLKNPDSLAHAAISFYCGRLIKSRYDDLFMVSPKGDTTADVRHAAGDHFGEITTTTIKRYLKDNPASCRQDLDRRGEAYRDKLHDLFGRFIESHFGSHGALEKAVAEVPQQFCDRLASEYRIIDASTRADKKYFKSEIARKWLVGALILPDLNKFVKDRHLTKADRQLIADLMQFVQVECGMPADLPDGPLEDLKLLPSNHGALTGTILNFALAVAERGARL